MKKVVTKEVHFCDKCGVETSYPYQCMGCGIEYCYNCKKNLLVEYKSGVHFSGSYDGDFCRKCDAKPPKHLEALLRAYQTILTLRREERGFYEDFTKRCEEAEARVKGLYEQAAKKYKAVTVAGA